jgi:hypothetical protein
VPFTVAGGQTSGTAQLAATASTSETSLVLSNTTNSPVSATTAAIFNGVSGQRSVPTRRRITARRSDSGTVFARSEARPSQARPLRRSPGQSPATANLSSTAVPMLAAISFVVAAI